MARSLVRRLASPFTKRVYGRIDQRTAELQRNMESVPNLIETRTADLADEIEALNRYLPIVINTIASQNAANRETQRQLEACTSRLDATEIGLRRQGESIVELYDRIEFVRKEVLLETRYGRRGIASTSDTGMPARVTNEDKLHCMEGNLRVNVGAGHITREGYLNVDSRELPGIDVVADVRDLPFEEREVSEIYSAHLLEHFPVEELRRVILPHWVSILEDGGKLVLVVPDVETMVAERASGRMSFDDFVEVMYGGQEYEGDFHFSGFSKETLTRLLKEVGLEDVKVIEEGRRNGACYEMEIEAVRRVAMTE
jgi:predicted SAM-dependent methyltransferase